VIDDESGESLEPMEEVPLKELGESKLENAWLMDRSRDLMTETRGSILERTICYSYRT